MKSLLKSFLGICLLTILPADLCCAATYTWNGSDSSDWFDALNWTPIGIPGTNDNIIVTNGSIDLSTDVVIGGEFDWSGGSLGDSSLTIVSNGVLNIQGTVTISNELDNFGTVNWQAGDIGVFYSGTGLNNEADGLWSIQCDRAMTAGVDEATFSNFGQTTKTTGTNTSIVGITFINYAEVAAAEGTLLFSNNLFGGEIAGNYQAASNASIYLNGYLDIDSTGNFAGPGTVQITNGLIDGDIGGTINWSGGSNDYTLTVLSGGTLNLQGSVSLCAVLNTYGTVNWQAGDIGVFYSGTGLNNEANGLWSIQCDRAMTGGVDEATFSNFGQTIKTAGTNTTTVGIAFLNYAEVTAAVGTLWLGNNLYGGLVSGNYQAASNASIYLNGYLDIDSSGSFTGPGTVQITNGLIDGEIGGIINWAGGTNDSDLTVLSNGVLNIQGAVVLEANILNSGTINLNSGSVSNQPFDGQALIVNNNGQVIKPAGTNTFVWAMPIYPAMTITVNSGTLEFSQQQGGPMELEGTFIALPDAAIVFNGQFQTSTGLNLTGAIELDGVLDNYATVNVESGSFLLTNASAIGNMEGATWNINGDIPFYAPTDAEFDNAGTVIKTAGTNVLNFYPAFQNAAEGLLQVMSGSFVASHIDGGTLLQGTFQVATNASIREYGYNVLVGPVHCEGPGIVQMSGTLEGTLAGNINWACGDIDLIVTSNGTFDIQGHTIVDGYLVNNGTVNWQSGAISLQPRPPYTTGESAIMSAGRWNIQCDESVTFSNSQASFNNTGLITKTGTTGANSIQPPFYNAGTLAIESGALQFNSAPLLSGGTVCLGINSLTNFGKIIVPGSLPIAGGLNVHLNGGYSPSPSNSFALIQYDSATGTFNPVNLPRHIAWQTNYTPAQFVLTALGHEATLIPLMLASGAAGQPPTFAFQFNGDPNQNYSVLATTNLALPLPTWTNLGSPSMLSNGLYRFSDPQSTNLAARFYILQSP